MNENERRKKGKNRKNKKNRSENNRIGPPVTFIANEATSMR